jgi:hypothetical protein
VCKQARVGQVIAWSGELQETEQWMDSGQFDQISRRLATRSNRRDAVRTGGVMAAVAGAFGFRSVAAQTDDTTDCTWVFKAVVLDGPNKDATYEGILKTTVQKDGGIDKGSLETESAEPYTVTGDSHGRALSFRIKISSDLALACVGIGERNIKSCQGQIDGTFAGPEFGDFGVWRIERKTGTSGSGTPTAVASTSANATATKTSGGGGNTGGGGGNQNPTATAKPQPTKTPCPPQDCGLVKTWDADQCKCVCYQGGVDCGPDLCCPTGSICQGTTSCSCPSGTVLCGNACVDDCSGKPGTYLDNNSCTCKQGCPSGQVLCNGTCVACTAQQQLDTNSCLCVDLCPSGQKFCNGVCKDVVNDKNNCGSCGNVCPTGMPCIAGTCECPATMKYCAGQQKCIDENLTC